MPSTASPNGAATLAARDLDVLTASGVDDLTAVRATRLDSALSLFVVDGDALGATAQVQFAFDATTKDESAQRLVLDGRLLLMPDAERLGGVRVRRRQ